MALFKILTSRTLSRPGLAGFTVQIERGQLAVGDTFTCYDTHHPVEFVVLEVSGLDKKISLVCSGMLGFDNQFTSAIVDTDAIERPAAFRY
jgi:hypothetical protein